MKTQVVTSYLVQRERTGHSFKKWRGFKFHSLKDGTRQELDFND